MKKEKRRSNIHRSGLLLAVVCLLFSVTGKGQTIESVSFDQLQHKLDSLKGNIVIVNFWSTWCVPCVEELPEFEKMNADYNMKKVKVVLVNLDFNSKVKTNVEPFVQKKNLKSILYHLTDTDANTWIDKIDDSWSGSIPATVIYEPEGKKIFFNEGKVTYEQLVQIIQPLLNKH